MASDGPQESHEHEPPLPHAGALLPADFVTLVLSMHHAAVEALDAAEKNPEQRKDLLPMARHGVDLLGMLEQKTKGNLTGAEERVISQVLMELRIRYVRASGMSGGAAG